MSLFWPLNVFMGESNRYIWPPSLALFGSAKVAMPMANTWQMPLGNFVFAWQFKVQLPRVFRPPKLFKNPQNLLVYWQSVDWISVLVCWSCCCLGSRGAWVLLPLAWLGASCRTSAKPRAIQVLEVRRDPPFQGWGVQFSHFWTQVRTVWGLVTDFFL